MIQTTIITLLLLQFTQIAHGVTCDYNPCGLIAGIYDGYTGYCCYNIAPYYTDSVCTCPNGLQTVNAPCRTSTIYPTICTIACANGGVCNVINGQQQCNCPLGFSGQYCEISTIYPTICTIACANGGVCNVINGQQQCNCPLGFSGEYCEIQGIQTRCYLGLCQAGNCYEQTNGINIYAFCQCQPGYLGTTCSQSYFTCLGQGAYPDTAYCGIGRYFYCSQPYALPTSATCPYGQKFNRLTRQCDSTYQCT